MRIFDFALVSDWDSRLAELENLAEPERWKYLTVPAAAPLPILDSYIKHTFARLSEQSRIEISDDFAAFNTGLLTPSQEEIFGLFNVAARFDQNQPVSPRNKKWFLKSWARAGDRVLTGFSQLPSLASYWESPGDLVFDPSLRVESRVKP